MGNIEWNVPCSRWYSWAIIGAFCFPLVTVTFNRRVDHLVTTVDRKNTINEHSAVLSAWSQKALLESDST